MTRQRQQRRSPSGKASGVTDALGVRTGDQDRQADRQSTRAVPSLIVKRTWRVVESSHDLANQLSDLAYDRDDAKYGSIAMDAITAFAHLYKVWAKLTAPDNGKESAP